MTQMMAIIFHSSGILYRESLNLRLFSENIDEIWCRDKNGRFVSSRGALGLGVV